VLVGKAGSVVGGVGEGKGLLLLLVLVALGVGVHGLGGGAVVACCLLESVVCGFVE